MISELIFGQRTAPTATLAAVTMIGGNSNQVRDFKNGRARIVDVFPTNQVAGAWRIRSTKTEPIIGMQGWSHAAALPSTGIPQLPYGQAQPVYANDVLTIENAGSAVAGDIESIGLIIAYDSINGIEQPGFLNFQDIQRLRKSNPALIVETMTITIATGAAGGYSGSAALSTATHSLFNNTKYALLGYTTSVICAGIRLQSSTDFGPLAIGGPGCIRGDITKDYFMQLNMQHGVGIPTFNTINLGQILIDAVQDENGVDVLVTLFVVNLE